MNEKNIIRKTALYVEKSLCGVDPSHEYWDYYKGVFGNESWWPKGD